VTQLANDAARGDKKSIQLAFALLQALESAIEAQRLQVTVVSGALAGSDRHTMNIGDSPRGFCSEAGVLGALTGILGAMMALEVIRESVGFGEGLVGRLMLVDEPPHGRLGH
jgi:molybdopterin/thiamine biosynthesis adenylyltransferase